MSYFAHGIAQFADRLPTVSEFVSLGEGGTPVVELSRLAAKLNLERLSAKLETANPTGSYKDRVAAMSISLAKHRGYEGWIGTSSGNAGLAMAAYGARAGIRGFLCMVSTAPAEKRMPLMPYGVKVIAVEGVGSGGSADAGSSMLTLVEEAADRHGLFLSITANAFNPDGMRGIDTIGYELSDQTSDATHVYVPAGGGGLAASLARGLAQASMACAVVACQPTGCAPIVDFLSGKLDEPIVPVCTTVISALQLPNPPDGRLAADAVRASGGWGAAVSDDEILAAQRELAHQEGIFVEPAAAVPLAALIRDRRHGRIQPSDHPVLILTGAGWKDQSRYASQANLIPTAPVSSLPAIVSSWMSDHTL